MAARIISSEDPFQFIGQRGVAALIALPDQFKLRFYSMYWPEGVAILIPLRSYSIYWPRGRQF